MDQDDGLSGTISLIGFSLCLALIILHGFFPSDFTVDDHTIALVVAALLFLLIPILPTLARHLKTLQLPGGIRADFRDAVVQATDKLHRAQLTRPEPTGRQSFMLTEVSFEISDEDPNVRVAALAIGLEKVLRELMERLEMPGKLASLRRMAQLLEERGIVSPQQGGVLRDIAALRNAAVHGAHVSREDAVLFENLVRDFLDNI